MENISSAVTACLLVLILAAGRGFAEQNSAMNERLARMLKRCPAADQRMLAFFFKHFK